MGTPDGGEKVRGEDSQTGKGERETASRAEVETKSDGV